MVRQSFGSEQKIEAKLPDREQLAWNIIKVRKGQENAINVKVQFKKRFGGKRFCTGFMDFLLL